MWQEQIETTAISPTNKGHSGTLPPPGQRPGGTLPAARGTGGGRGWDGAPVAVMGIPSLWPRHIFQKCLGQQTV
jgi:hypothetical protein